MTEPSDDQPSSGTQSSIRDLVKLIIAGGVISAIAAVIVGIIEYAGTKYQTDQPIRATSAAQTAEAQQTQQTGATLTVMSQLTQTVSPSPGVSIIQAAPSPSPTTTTTPASLPTLEPLPDTNWSEQQLEVFSVIQRELNAIIANDLPALSRIYAEDALVVDVRGTPDDPTDDLVYQGWDEIRQRFLKTFAYDWLKATPVNLKISVDQETATAIHRGLMVNDIIYNQHVAYYELKKITGEWRIVRLEFDYR